MARAGDTRGFVQAMLAEDTAPILAGEEPTLVVEEADTGRMAAESKSGPVTPPPTRPAPPPVPPEVAGYELAMRHVREALLEDFSMPRQVVDLYLAQARMRGRR